MGHLIKSNWPLGGREISNQNMIDLANEQDIRKKRPNGPPLIID